MAIKAIVMLAAFTLAACPSLTQELLLDLTQSGLQLASRGDIVFHQPPEVVEEALVLTAFEDSLLFEWPLLPASTRRGLEIRLWIDYSRGTLDNDPTVGLHDGENLVGLLRSDNSQGALFVRESSLGNLILPPFRGTTLSGIDPLEAVFFSFTIPANDGPTVAAFREGTDRLRETFSLNPLDGDAPLTLFWGGGTTGERHRIHSLRVTVTELEAVEDLPIWAGGAAMLLGLVLFSWWRRKRGDRRRRALGEPGAWARGSASLSQAARRA